MNFFSLILGSLLFASAAEASRICKTERGRTVTEQLATLEPKVDLNLVDVDLFPGGSVVAGYEYEVGPAYNNGLYSRTDRWQISLKAIPERLINLEEGIDAKVSGGLRAQTEATFIRFVKDPCLAMKLNPYSPKRIPLKAKVALGPKFHIGDYFLFRTSGALVVSGEVLGLISNNPWGVSVGGSYLMEGFYQLHIVKLDAHHIRLKVVAHRGRKLQTHVGFGWTDQFEIFEINSLNNGLEKFVNTKPIMVKADFNKSKVFMVDYVLDLRDERVVVAFEKIVRKAKDFKNLKLTEVFKNEPELETNLFLDLAPLEELYQEDRQNNQIGRLKRNLRTTSKQDTYFFGVNLGNKIMGYKWNKENSTSLMGVRRDDNFQDKYLLKSWGDHSEGRFFYTWTKSSDQSGIRALFSANENFEELSPINLVNYRHLKKNRISHKSFLKVKRMLKKSLPKNVYESIPWENWHQREKDKFSNFGLRYEFVVSPEGLKEAPELTPSEVKVLFLDHIKSKNLKARDFFSPIKHGPRGMKVSSETQFDRSLKIFTKNFSKALDKKLPTRERLSHLTKLRKNALFNQVGFSFFMSLTPVNMRALYHLDVNLTCNEAAINYSYGDVELSGLYKKLLTIKAALDDDSLDLLREAESISSQPTQSVLTLSF